MFSSSWLEIISEVLIDISAGLFLLALSDPLVSGNQSWQQVMSSLTVKTVVAIITLFLAKKLRDRSRQK